MYPLLQILPKQPTQTFSQGTMSMFWHQQQDLGPCFSEKLVKCTGAGVWRLVRLVLTVSIVGCALVLSDRDQGCCF